MPWRLLVFCFSLSPGSICFAFLNAQTQFSSKQLTKSLLEKIIYICSSAVRWGLERHAKQWAASTESLPQIAQR